jgi:siroheme synthase-like protein
MDTTNTLFPVFLKLENLRLLIVGGGVIGLEKVTAVLANSPATHIVLVAPEFLPELLALAQGHNNLVLKQKCYDSFDLENADLVITATGNRELSAQIKQEANFRQLLVNVADTPDLCDFYLGSVVQRGDLKIAISTNGKSPTMAKRVKEMLHAVLPEDLQSVLENMSKIRKSLKGDFAMKVKKLNDLTSVMLENPVDRRKKAYQKALRRSGWVLGGLGFLYAGYVLLSSFPLSWVLLKTAFAFGLVLFVFFSIGLLYTKWKPFSQVELKDK